MKITIPGTVSLQNPAWSPDGKVLSLTDWRGGYNKAPGRVLTYDLTTKAVDVIAGGNYSNCSQPGACWHKDGGIIFSSDRWGDDGDQICRFFRFDEPLMGIERLTRMPGHVGYEPTWAPDGQRFAFEQHIKDQEKNGRIMCGHIGLTQMALGAITTNGDCRQPCWSPDGSLIVYQRMDDDWTLHIITPDGKVDHKLVLGTDATWHPDGRILYSDEDGRLALLDLRSLYGVHVGPTAGYHGAPSVSPDGKQIACEAADKPPEDGDEGTWIEIFDL